jgi:four helix bundle protein
MKHSLSHENLDAYRLARDVARWMRSTRFPTGDSALRDQAVRAASSCVLNIAEGCYSLGGNRKKHFRIAMGSAAETCAVLDLVELPSGDQRQVELRRVVAMLCKLK